jgi:hypothetical protein
LCLSDRRVDCSLLTGFLALAEYQDHKNYFDALPPEILDRVIDLIQDRTLNNIRAASKSLEERTRYEFIRRHFRERNHMMTRFGIETLVNISRHPFFGPALKVVTFNVSTDALDAEYLDREQFCNSIRDIFSNIKRYQTHQHNGITIGLSDNSPQQRRVSCSELLYRIAEKPSYGFYRLMGTRRFPSIFSWILYNDSVGLITMGDAMQRIMPLAIGTGCRIKGLDIRLVGRLHLTERRVCAHQPTMQSTLWDLGPPAEWDVKFSVVDPDREEVSMVQYTKQERKLKFTNFAFGDFDFKTASINVYDVASVLFPEHYSHLELINCSVLNTDHFKTQMEELSDCVKYKSKAKLLQSLVIRGLCAHVDSTWAGIFRSLAKIRILKHCHIEGLHRPLPEDEGDDQVEEDEKAEKDEEDGENEEHVTKDFKGSGDELGEDGAENRIDSSADKTKAPPTEARRRVACLQRMLAGVEIEVHEEDDRDIVAELLKTSLYFESIT